MYTLFFILGFITGITFMAFNIYYIRHMPHNVTSITKSDPKQKSIIPTKESYNKIIHLTSEREENILKTLGEEDE